MKMLKSLFEKTGFLIMRATRRNRAYSAGLQNDFLGYVLEREIDDPSGLRFLQIGANDGSHVDPIARLIDFYGWHGVCVEPMPQPYAKLEAFYAGNPRVKTVNAAISHQTGPMTLYTLIPADGQDVRNFSALSSFSREVPERFCRDHGIKAEIHEVEVPGIPFAQLLEDYGLEKLDVLQIDAEGFDYHILKQIDFTQFTPRLLNFEHAHMSLAEIREILDLLIRAGYKFACGTSDVTAWQFHAGTKIPKFYREVEGEVTRRPTGA